MHACEYECAFMCVYTHGCVSVHENKYVCMHAHIRTYINTHVHTYVCMHFVGLVQSGYLKAWLLAYENQCTFLLVFMPVYVCVYHTYIYICMNVCVYVHIQGT